MFKKLLGSLSKDEAAANAAKMDYAVPEVMPNLNPDLNAILPKIKLPDSVKKQIQDPSILMENPDEAAAEMSKGVAGDLAADAASTAVAASAGEEASTGVGKALSTAVENANGESTPFLASILTDPRFAIIGVNFLALGLKKETAILWAVECTSLGYAIANEQKKASGSIEMSPEEEMALSQARAYANGEEVPAEELSALAVEAGMDKPGALAAQAAAWDMQPPPPEAGDPDVLVGDMVAGAVMLAAAMTMPEPEEPQLPQGAELPMPPADAPLESAEIVPEDPKAAAPAAKRLKPFIDKGLELAAAG